MKETIKTIKRTEYTSTCPICQKEIKGLSESQVKYNIQIHIHQKHAELNLKEVKQ